MLALVDFEQSSRKARKSALVAIDEICEMSSNIVVDRISLLPKDITNSILSRLKIKEAVRTSILSKSWRYRWHSLLKIEINRLSFPSHNGQLQFSQASFNNKIVKIIDHILSVHCGSVEKFELDVDLETSMDIDRWILYVSRNGIKELIISLEDEFYDLPSSIFSCYNLINLQLKRCIFESPPAAFKTFSNLAELLFEQVVITDEGLENILNSGPFLSRLSLLEVSPHPSLKIIAPNLVRLHIDGFYSYCQFFSSFPLLTSVTFGLGDHHVYSPIADDQDCMIVELLGSMPVLRRLEFDFCALQHVAGGNVPVRLPFVCRIIYLRIYVNFEDLQELLVAFCIFRSSPFISDLELTFWSGTTVIPAEGFLNGEHDFGFKFDHLKRAQVNFCNGIENELKFIEYLLANAPVLEQMNIHIDCYGDKQESLAVITKLIRFPRVSPKAEIFIWNP